MPGKEQSTRLNQNKKKSLLIFIRAPEKGKVKTRLARFMDEKKVLDLYMGFVEKTLSSAVAAGFSPIVFFCPENKKQLVTDWLGNDYDYQPQKGRDLGERMENALSLAFKDGALKAVLIGSDIPDMEPDHLRTAFENLSETDVVIAPSTDGGYWLIGFTKSAFSGSVFRNINWSTGTVCDQTVLKCKANGLSVSFLPVLNDIDTIDDLTQYQSDL